MITASFKDHEIREFVNRLADDAKIYANCQSLRDVLSREVMRTLKKQEEKTNVPAPK